MSEPCQPAFVAPASTESRDRGNAGATQLTFFIYLTRRTTMDIIIKRQEKCFKSSFFKMALERALNNLFKNIKTKEIKIITQQDEAVTTACQMLELDYEVVEASAHPDADAIIAFWDGPKYSNMPAEMIDPSSEKIAEFIQHYQSVNEGGMDVRHQFPNWKFRAIQTIFEHRNRGIEIDKQYAIKQFLKFKKLTNNLEEMLHMDEDSSIIHNQDVIQRTRFDAGGADGDVMVDETNTVMVSEEKAKRQLLNELDSARWSRNLWDQITMNLESYGV
jgi:hypothetical protein